MLAFRRQKNHAHGEVELYRENLNEIDKHLQCYKKIIVLKRKFRDDFVKFCEKLQVNTFRTNGNLLYWTSERVIHFKKQSFFNNMFVNLKKNARKNYCFGIVFRILQ